MDLSGKVNFNLKKEQVWDALHDVEILKSAIPGCEELKLIEDGSYEVSMNLGVAAVKGNYKGKIIINDIEKPVHYTLEAEGSGGPGHVKAFIDCKIEDNENGCVLNWECKAEIGGMIASVGSRVLKGVAKFMAGKFFEDIKKQMKKIA